MQTGFESVYHRNTMIKIGGIYDTNNRPKMVLFDGCE